MTRKEQIELALKDLNEVPLDKDRPYFDYGFSRGVEWADINPNRGAYGWAAMEYKKRIDSAVEILTYPGDEWDEVVAETIKILTGNVPEEKHKFARMEDMAEAEKHMARCDDPECPKCHTGLKPE